MILFTNIFAQDSHWEKLIVEKILKSMTNKEDIMVYTTDKGLKSLVSNIKDITLINSCQKADFILSLRDRNISCHKPEVVFDYANYLYNKNAVGLFFWQKGRPTIRFSSKRLENFGLHIHGELSKFVSSKN